MRKRHRHRPEWGFTLLEILLVLTLVAMIATLLGTSIAGRVGALRVATAANDLTAALRYTRSQAILSRREQVLEVDVEARQYRAPGSEPVELPETIELKLLTAGSEVSGDRTGRIRFFPDGGSTGGRVSLIAGQREWKVNVSWLTGEIEVDDGREARR